MVLTSNQKKAIRYFVLVLVLLIVTIMFLDRNTKRSFMKQQNALKTLSNVFQTTSRPSLYEENISPQSSRRNHDRRPKVSQNSYDNRQGSESALNQPVPPMSLHLAKPIQIGWDDVWEKRGHVSDETDDSGILGTRHHTSVESFRLATAEPDIREKSETASTGTPSVLVQNVSNVGYPGDGVPTITRRRKVEGLFNNPRRPVRTTVTYEDGYIVIKRSGMRSYTETRLEKSEMDIMNLKPLEFDPRFKNPCWYGNSSSNSLFEDSRLHCLPYFYLLGVKKSATTDLFYRMTMHPQFIRPPVKEAQWFPRLRFKSIESVYRHGTSLMKALIESGFDNKNVTFYIGMYDSVTNIIERTSQRIGEYNYYPLITGDATPANLHLNTIWEFLPGNENLTEPKYTNLNYIKHLNPNAKIIIIFRDPVTRLYSDFLHMSHRVRVGDRYVFHRHCAALTSAYTECLRCHTLRECVYNNSIVRDLQARGVAIAESFLSSFYSVYMKDIYNLFDKSNVLPLLTSDYTSHTEDVLKRVFRFLDLVPMPKKRMAYVLRLDAMNQSKRKGKSLGPMLPETADLLYQFFSPFNKQMAELMNDQRYMFERPDT